jgi:aspartate racemase
MPGSLLTVGVLGGMGPAATADFLSKVTAVTDADGDQGHIHMIIDSDPSVPDRTAHLLEGGPDPRPRLAEMALRLERAGADLLVIACNTAHAYLSELAPTVAIPIVDWPGVVAGAVACAASRRPGVLASTGTIAAGIYQHALGSFSLRAIEPPEAFQHQLMEAIYGDQGVKRIGASSSSARERLLAAARATVATGADCVVLACTEFSAVHTVAPLDIGVPVFDGAEVVARHVVTLVGGTVR